MIGINYRYEFNDKKNTIKLAPTKSVMVTSLVLIAAPYVVIGGAALVDYVQDRKWKKTTNTEDFTVPR